MFQFVNSLIIPSLPCNSKNSIIYRDLKPDNLGFDGTSSGCGDTLNLCLLGMTIRFVVAFSHIIMFIIGIQSEGM